jgi:hypothetical protein
LGRATDGSRDISNTVDSACAFRVEGAAAKDVSPYSVLLSFARKKNIENNGYGNSYFGLIHLRLFAITESKKLSFFTRSKIVFSTVYLSFSRFLIYLLNFRASKKSGVAMYESPRDSANGPFMETPIFLQISGISL